MTTLWSSAYPVSLDAYVPLVDHVDSVLANHPDTLAVAIVALESKIGITNGIATGFGGLSFSPIGHATFPGVVGNPTVWIDNSFSPGHLIFTNSGGADFDILNNNWTVTGTVLSPSVANNTVKVATSVTSTAHSLEIDNDSLTYASIGLTGANNLIAGASHLTVGSVTSPTVGAAFYFMDTGYSTWLFGNSASANFGAVINPALSAVFKAEGMIYDVKSLNVATGNQARVLLYGDEGPGLSNRSSIYATAEAAVGSSRPSYTKFASISYGSGNSTTELISSISATGTTSLLNVHSLSGGAGTTEVNIYSQNGDINFKARSVATAIPFSSAAPNNALVGFTATSIVGALNEVKSGVTSATLWSKASTTLSPLTANDKVSVTSADASAISSITGIASGSGVYTNIGGDFSAAGSTGIGVKGYSTGATGSGVYGQTNQNTGYSGYFTGGKFTATGYGDIAFLSSNGNISFDDQYLSSAINISQSGTTGLVGYTATSIVAALNEVRASAPSAALLLDQTTPQSVINGRATFAQGLLLGLTPTPGTHTDGKVYWDETWKTMAVQQGSDVTLQVGQEDLSRVYNNSGATIHNGEAVYTTGIYSGGTNDVMTIALAKSDTDVKAFVLGVATQDIPNSSYGFITVRGYINGLNTNRIGSAYLVTQGMAFDDLVGGTTGNAYTFTVVDTGIGGLSYTEVLGAIIVDLGGAATTRAQLVTLMTVTTPSAIVDVHLETAGNVIVASVLSFSGGVVTTAGSELYLCPAVPGKLCVGIPTPPNLEVKVGRLITKSATLGRINIHIDKSYRLNDLVDVTAPTPVIDEVLKYNGSAWVNGTVGSVGAGPGIEFFNCTPVFNSAVSPSGLSQDGTTGNGIRVNSLSKSPVTSVSSVVTISNGSPAVITWAAHGLPISAPVVFTNSGGSLPTGLTAGTTYYILSTGYAAGSFRVSLSVEGVVINTSSAGSGTHTCTSVEQTAAGLANADTRAFVAWIYNTALGRTTIDAGVWDFMTFAGVSSIGAGRVTTLTRGIYQVVPVASGTVTITNLGANTKTATITSSQFAGTYFAASATNTTASYLQTPSGIYQISAVASVNSVTIIVPTGYTNESTVTFNVWNKLFSVTSSAITSISPSYTQYNSIVAQPAFTIAATDKLGQIGFITSNASTTLTVAYNGAARNTHFSTPLVTLHNNLAGLNAGDYVHLTVANHTDLTDGGSTTLHTHAYLPLSGGTLTGNLLFTTDNTLDIGAVGATRPRTAYLGTSLISPAILATANDSGAIGASGTAFSDLFLASGGVINWAANNVSLTHATGSLTLAATTFALGTTNLTMTGSIAATGARVTKGWFADLESTSGIVLGFDATPATPNTAGYLKMFSAGDNAFYTTFTAGTQTANATYTLPLAPPTVDGQSLTSTTAGVMSWGTIIGGDSEDGMAVYKNIFNDFTAVYKDSDEIELVGLPFNITAVQIKKITRKPTGTAVSVVKNRGVDLICIWTPDVAIAGKGSITTTSLGTLASTDEYIVEVEGEPKGYMASTDSNKSYVVNDVMAINDGLIASVSSDDVTITKSLLVDGFNAISLNVIIGAVGDFVQVYGTNDPAGTSPYHDITALACGVPRIVTSGAYQTSGVIMFPYIQIVVDGNTTSAQAFLTRFWKK